MKLLAINQLKVPMKQNIISTRTGHQHKKQNDAGRAIAITTVLPLKFRVYPKQGSSTLNNLMDNMGTIHVLSRTLFPICEGCKWGCLVFTESDWSQECCNRTT